MAGMLSSRVKNAYQSICVEISQQQGCWSGSLGLGITAEDGLSHFAPPAFWFVQPPGDWRISHDVSIDAKVIAPRVLVVDLPVPDIMHVPVFG